MQFLEFLHYVDSRQQGTSGHDGENPGTSSSTHDHTEQVVGVEKFTVCQTKTMQAQLTMKSLLWPLQKTKVLSAGPSGLERALQGRAPREGQVQTAGGEHVQTIRLEMKKNEAWNRRTHVDKSVCPLPVSPAEVHAVTATGAPALHQPAGEAAAVRAFQTHHSVLCPATPFPPAAAAATAAAAAAAGQEQSMEEQLWNVQMKPSGSLGLSARWLTTQVCQRWRHISSQEKKGDYRLDPLVTD